MAKCSCDISTSFYILWSSTCQKVLHNLNSRSEVLFLQGLLNKEAQVEVFVLHKKICQEFVISLFPFQRENEEYIWITKNVWFVGLFFQSLSFYNLIFTNVNIIIGMEITEKFIHYLKAIFSKPSLFLNQSSQSYPFSYILKFVFNNRFFERFHYIF